MLQAFEPSRVNFYPSTLPGGKPRNSIRHLLKLQVKRVAVTCTSAVFNSYSPRTLEH